jgi:hypothetical protein
MRSPERLSTAGADLIRRLDDLVIRIDREFGQSSETLALLRQSLDHMVFAGMVLIPAGGAPYHSDWTVPFASLAIADPNGAGPLVVSTDGASGANSLGQVQLAVGDAACVPLHGRYVDITGAAGKSIFVAAFTRAQPFFWGKC